MLSTFSLKLWRARFPQDLDAATRNTALVWSMLWLGLGPAFYLPFLLLPMLVVWFSWSGFAIGAELFRPQSRVTIGGVGDFGRKGAFWMLGIICGTLIVTGQYRVIFLDAWLALAILLGATCFRIADAACDDYDRWQVEFRLERASAMRFAAFELAVRMVLDIISAIVSPLWIIFRPFALPILLFVVAFIARDSAAFSDACFIIGLGLAGWCGGSSLSEHARTQWCHMSDARMFYDLFEGLAPALLVAGSVLLGVYLGIDKVPAMALTLFAALFTLAIREPSHQAT